MTAPGVPSELLDPVVALLRPRRAILFGSAARGDAGPDSDIDLLVILDDAPPKMQTPSAGWRARRGLRGAADAVPVRESTYRRKSRIAGAESAEFVALLARLDIRVDAGTADRGLKEILALARGKSLTAYDAAYLDLAMREGLALATRDSMLARAARRVGVELVPT